MLFQAYTGGRPAEFVHASKGKASQDPLGKAEHANNRRRPREAQNEDFLRWRSTYGITKE